MEMIADKKENSIVWGLGIEHECNFYLPRRLFVDGTSIQQHLCTYPLLSPLSNRPPRQVSRLRNLFLPQRRYPVPIQVNVVPWFLVLKHHVLGYLPGKFEQNAWQKLDQSSMWFQKLQQRAVCLLPQQVETLHNVLPHIELDVSDLAYYLEFISSQSENATVTKICHQINYLQTMFQSTMPIPIETSRYGSVAPVVATNQDLVGSPVKSWLFAGDYGGSYHVNISLPHDPKSALDLQHQRTAAAMLVLQYVEPLLVGYYGQVDPFAGTSRLFSRGSYRMMTSPDSALAIQKVSWPWMDHQLQERRPEELTGRTARDRALEILQGYTEPEAAGSDFRRDPDKGPTFGFEFRILDHLPLFVFRHVLRIILLLCDHGLALWQQDQLPPDPRNQAWYLDLLQHALIHGSSKSFPSIALEYLFRQLKCRFHSKMISDPLAALTRQLWLRYGHGKGLCLSLMDPDHVNVLPRVQNWNLASLWAARRFWQNTLHN